MVKKNKNLVNKKKQEVIIPDEALSYIVTHFIKQNNKGDLPIVIGISSHTVETVLQLLIDWSTAQGYVKDGILSLGVQELN